MQISRSTILPVVINEAEPWLSLVSVLIGHLAFQSTLSDSLTAQLINVFQVGVPRAKKLGNC